MRKLHPIHRGMTWLGKLKLRVLVMVIGIPLATLGAISITPAWLTLPLVGVAVAAVTVTVAKITSRMDSATCWTCGADLSGEARGAHGALCPKCGTLHDFTPPTLARHNEHESSEPAGFDGDGDDGSLDARA